MMSRRFIPLLALLMIFAATLRVATLRHEAVDTDELFSRRVALLPVPQLFGAVRADLVHPPMYYLILKAGILVWGAGPVGMRLWSLIFGLATIAVTVRLGNSLPGAKFTGFLAGLMLASNGDMIFYSQQARSYAFYGLLVTCLLLWTTSIEDSGLTTRRWGWIAAFGLMTAAVYTHYVGAVYVSSVVGALLLCRISSRIKALVLLASVLSALSFVPWIIAIAGVYRYRHGVGANLDWQGHPALHDLKSLWASAVGVSGFRGATTLSILIAASLIFSALRSDETGKSILLTPALLSLIAVSTVPPVFIFVLSSDPIGLPLFGLRHLLPSIIAVTILVSYGFERLVSTFPRWRRVTLPVGAVLLIGFGLIPTVKHMNEGPARYPYDAIARDTQHLTSGGRAAFATWDGIADPVNFYCGGACVSLLPVDVDHLPESLYLLYRPNVSSESDRYDSLIRHGFKEDSRQYYTNGARAPWGTSLVALEKQNPPKVQPLPIR